MKTEKFTTFNRRQLFKSALSILPFLALTPIAEGAKDADVVSYNAATVQLPDKIRELESALRKYPDQFSWAIHNELRHEYLAVSERLSRKHADIILSHVVMDNYIMNTISDWHLTHTSPDPQLAIVILLKNVEQYHFLPHLRAACLVKAGDVYASLDMKSEAIECYEAVAEHRASFAKVAATLRPYQHLASLRCNIIDR